MSRKPAHIIGLGRSGQAAANWLLLHNWDVVVSDDAGEDKLAAAAQKLQISGAVVCLGGHSEALKVPVDLVVVSPGVPMNHPAILTRLSQGVEVIGELELGWRNSRGAIAAITASNGKSTATALTGEIFAASGRPAFTAGNIGIPLISIAGQTSPDSLIAVEVSSYQLESIKTFKPKAAAILNITPDHLQRHGTFEAYTGAKSRLCMNQDVDDFLIFNADDKIVCDITHGVRSQKIPFSTERQLEFGGWIAGGAMHLSPTKESQHYTLPRSALALPGVHNTQNALAAILSALACGVKWQAIECGVRNFKGLPHRLEFVRRLNGVNWINDSKATNVDSGLTALKALNAPIILIAGGRPKGGGFKDLRPLMKAKVKSLIVLGEAAAEIAADLGDLCSTHFVHNLEEAVHFARQTTAAGDTVLLSPLCASFDMFDNFEQRGDVFKELVGKLES